MRENSTRVYCYRGSSRIPIEWHQRQGSATVFCQGGAGGSGSNYSPAQLGNRAGFSKGRQFRPAHAQAALQVPGDWRRLGRRLAQLKEESYSRRRRRPRGVLANCSTRTGSRSRLLCQRLVHDSAGLAAYRRSKTEDRRQKIEDRRSRQKIQEGRRRIRRACW